MFQPIIPAPGLSGWNFLQATYDRQLKSFTDAPQVRNDQAYLSEKLSKPVPVDEFLSDRRLLRTALTAFDLGGEAWKRGFLKKVLTEAADPQSTFLTRLNNSQYSRFADVFRPVAGKIMLSADALSNLGTQFGAASFENAVGEIDNDMRLSLNYKSEIGELVKDGSSESAILYRLLGSVPVRTVLERAMNLPTDIQRLPIERQADALKQGLATRFGIRDLSLLTSSAMIEKVVERFNAVQAASSGLAGAPGSSVLALFSGIGSVASENLFRSRMS